MEIKAEQKFLLISPRKIRPVVDLIKKMKPEEAVERLVFINKRGAVPLAKVIKQAIANARQKSLENSVLSFKEIQINEGPRLKRGRPVSRGRWHPVKRRMSHIRVVLTTQLKSQNSNVKTERAKEQEKTELKKDDKKGGEAGRGTLGASSE